MIWEIKIGFSNFKLGKELRESEKDDMEMGGHILEGFCCMFENRR